MAKDEILAKLKLKDYNDELESILEKKDFSSDVKNLLLSMLYKIENGYRDYNRVKTDVLDKNQLIQQIITTIDQRCNIIHLIEPLSMQSKELQKIGKGYSINKEKGIIESYPNEKDLLRAIYELAEKEVMMQEKYASKQEVIQELLNKGNIDDCFEIVRDFNGWSWYTTSKEIQYFSYNLIFQNLRILTNRELLDNWLNSKEQKDYPEQLRKLLKESIQLDKVQTFLILFYQVISEIYYNFTEERKQKLKEKLEKYKKELQKLEKKEIYLEEISKKKKGALDKINRIDRILNSQKLLKEEFEKRNKKLKKEEKIFSVSYLAEILEKDRKYRMLEVQRCADIMDPMKYVKRLNTLKSNVEFLQDISIEKEEKQKNKMIDFQKSFLDCYLDFVENAQTKKQLMELIYTLRYYQLIYISENMQIKDVEELQEKLKEVKEKLIQQAIVYKLMNPIINDKEISEQIIESIFELRLIELEELEIKIEKTEKEIKIEYLDKENIEKQIILSEIDSKEWKNNKKIKLFNF